MKNEFSFKTKVFHPFIVIFMVLTLNSCDFLKDVCFEFCVLSYGEIKVESAATNERRVNVGMGDLSEGYSKGIRYNVVLTTTEYPDNAPPYTKNVTITPLSTDFDFISPSTDSNRKPFLLSPHVIYGVSFDVVPKTTPIKLLYLYLVEEQSTTYISSGLPHITVDLNKYPVK